MRKRSSAALSMAFDAYFDRSLYRRGLQISNNALTAASSAFRSMTAGTVRAPRGAYFHVPESLMASR
jgi:hypothetical protein